MFSLKRLFVGVQFMWDCCCESVKKTKKSSGSGCILAHCMGLGKTLQVHLMCLLERTDVALSIFSQLIP